MKHNISVMSRDNAVRYTKDNNIPPTIIISIRNIGDLAPEFWNNPYIYDICYLEFDDVEEGVLAMSLDQACETLEFVEKWLEEDVDIVVHCSAGVSRSAGTAAALMLLVNGDDSPIFNSSRYAPNMNCYRKVLTAAGYSYTEDELGEKYQHQFDLWLAHAKANGLI